MINIFGKQNASAAAKKLDTKKELRKKKAAKGQVCVAAKSVKKKMDPNASRLQQMGNVEKSKNKKLSKRLVSLTWSIWTLLFLYCYSLIRNTLTTLQKHRQVVNFSNPIS